MTKCTQCGESFSAREALCDDWRDPARAFGCPHCGTFFIKDLRPRWIPATISGLAAGGIAVPAFFLLMDAVRSNDVEHIVMSGMIIVSLLAAAVLLGLAEREALRVSPYRRREGAPPQQYALDDA